MEESMTLNIELEDNTLEGLQCPIPLQEYPRVLLAHGGGGRLMRQLIEKMFLAAFDNPVLNLMNDAAVLKMDSSSLAITTDSYVVQPLFFPGGDIGSLSVFGTVNDLAMCGAEPLYLSVGFILEEGLPMETLWKVVRSMKIAAQQTGVQIVAGDTKVIDTGAGDGLYINTTGIGKVRPEINICPAQVRSGDVVLVNGDIGRHGIAIMAVREGLKFETTLESDCAPLAEVVKELVDSGVELHCLRDLTRGGLAAALIEIAHSGKVPIHIREKSIAVQEDVRGACEILGLDPLYVANEGRFVAILPEKDSEKASAIIRKHFPESPPRLIGTVKEGTQPEVTLENFLGSHRVLDLPSGEQLPRIC
jgi:hydrogenase expression/formation protein HypE